MIFSEERRSRIFHEITIVNYQKAKKENNDKIESLFYYIVNNQELLAKDRAEILLTGSVKVE